MDLRGHLDVLLLGTLDQIGPAHGYALIIGLREQSDGAFDLPEGSVYPALHRLERGGFVASEWSTDAPRRRRIYRLTSQGREALSTKRAEWRIFAAGMQSVIGRRAMEGLA